MACRNEESECPNNGGLWFNSWNDACEISGSGNPACASSDPLRALEDDDDTEINRMWQDFLNSLHGKPCKTYMESAQRQETDLDDPNGSGHDDRGDSKRVWTPQFIEALCGNRLRSSSQSSSPSPSSSSSLSSSSPSPTKIFSLEEPDSLDMTFGEDLLGSGQHSANALLDNTESPSQDWAFVVFTTIGPWIYTLPSKSLT